MKPRPTCSQCEELCDCLAELMKIMDGLIEDKDFHNVDSFTTQPTKTILRKHGYSV